MFKNIYPKTHDHQVNIIQLKCADWKVSDGLGFCSPWNWPVVWASYKLSGSDICMIDWIGQVVNLNWLLRQYLSNRRVSRHSHLTLPQWHEDVMCSSQALIWQGIPTSASKDVTAVWGGTPCTGEVIQLHRQGFALSLPSSFIIYQSVHNVRCTLQAAGITVPQKREGDESQHMPKRKQTPASIKCSCNI